jgi:hypothetical protein
VIDESEAESIPNASVGTLQTMVEAIPEMEVEVVEVIETEAEEKLTIGRLAIAIKKASNIVELKAVYDANKHKIETNTFIKEQLKSRKNELLKG